MSDRYFIDECLSASLVAVAKERGVLADYGPHIGLAGWQDWNIARFAFENDYIVVTNNRRDFLKEYLKQEMHNGLIIIVPNVEREAQISLFCVVLDYIAETVDAPVNKVIEVLRDRTLHVRTWTADDHDGMHIGSPTWAAGGR